MPHWLDELQHLPFVQGKYSQNNEETVLNTIFLNIGTNNRYCVEFGAGDGYRYSNTAALREAGWDGLLMDIEGTGEVKKEFITRENILLLLAKYQVPLEFDLLSIDIDGNDLYVLKELVSEYSPRVILNEFNGTLPVDSCRTIQYDPDWTFKLDDYFGASFNAFKKTLPDYTCIHQIRNMNQFFLRNDLAEGWNGKVTYKQDGYWGGNTTAKWVELSDMDLLSGLDPPT
jgi:hypothetical protein